MARSRGTTFAVALLAILAVALAAVVAWRSSKHRAELAVTEKIEAAAQRGGAVPARPLDPKAVEAREHEEARAFAERHGGSGLKQLVGTEHYNALSPECRGFIDAYVEATDKPDVSAADRQRAEEAESSFGASCT